MDTMKTILVDAVHGLIIENGNSWIIFEDMKKLLDSFPNRKILVTGAFGEKYVEYGLDRAPYEVFTLKHDPEKSDPKYFQILLERYKLTANDVVYFEHNPDAVKSAESVGIVSNYYDENKKDLKALKQFLTVHLSV